MIENKTLVCRCCKEDKPEEEYYGSNKQCNDCLKVKRKIWRDNNKEKTKEATLRYLKKNPDKHREYMKRWREKNKEHFNEYQKLYQRKRKKELRENDTNG